MKRVYVAIFILLASSLAMAQGSLMMRGIQQPINGIVIKESSFDPQTKNVSLKFINDRSAEISAYHYCINIVSTNKDVGKQECYLIDAADFVINWKAQLKLNPMMEKASSMRNACDQCPVSPGEERVIEKEVAYSGVTYASIVVDFVAWFDQTWQGDPLQFARLIDFRTVSIKNQQFISATIKNVLASGKEVSMLDTVLTALQKEYDATSDGMRQKDLGWAMRRLRDPERYHSGKADAHQHPREFLERQIPYHDSLAAEFEKQIIFKKAEGQ